MARSVSDLGKYVDGKFGVLERRPAKCTDHGDFISVVRRNGTAEAVSGCPTCAAAKREIDELNQKRFDFRMLQLEVARIPQRFAKKTFTDFHAEDSAQQTALDACVAYVNDFSKHRRDGRCMLLLGLVGTGKTHLSVAVIKQLIDEQMVRAIYRTASGILGDIKATFNDRQGPNEADILHEVVAADLLVLDEVGATKQSEFELATLFTIINGRYEQNRPTIIVSNLSPSELNDAIGMRCVDRIRENGCIGIPFEWESHRGKEVVNG
jgi:DNA replication protein DnaC